MDIGQVGGLSAERSSIVYDLKLDLFTGVVDSRHWLVTMALYQTGSAEFSGYAGKIRCFLERRV